MSKIVAEITMSLDGFCAGPDISLEALMGVGGERLHDWMFGVKEPDDQRVLDESFAAAGAVLMGRHTYDLGIDRGWGGENPFPVPVFVITHRPVSKKVAGFDYVTEGPETAIARAENVAGGKDIWLMGGARTIQVFLAADWVDELYIHIAPVLLCGGLRLFDNIGSRHIELENISGVQTAAAHHLRFRIAKG